MDSPTSLLCGEKLVFSALADCRSDLKPLANVADSSGPRLACRRKARGESVSVLSSNRRKTQGVPAVNRSHRSFLQPNSAVLRPVACHQQQQQVDYRAAFEIQQPRCLARPRKTVGHMAGCSEKERRKGRPGEVYRGRTSMDVCKNLLVPPGVCKDSLALLLEKAAQPYYRVSKLYVESLQRSRVYGTGELCKRRRESVNLIFKLASLRRQSTLVAAHAVDFVDRFLSQKHSASEEDDDMALVGAACFWIAAKMEDSATPNFSILLACENGLQALDCDEETILRMEVAVLRALGWRMLSVTTSDFVATIVADLQGLGIFQQRWTEVADRADEIIQGILPEVEFLAYEPSVVSICVIQCLLDETVPVQAAAHMASIRKALAVDMVAASECYKLLIDLVVDPISECNIPSP